MVAVFRVPGILCAVTLLAAVSLTGCGRAGSGDIGDSEAEEGAEASEGVQQPDDFGCLTTAEAEAASITFASTDSTERAAAICPAVRAAPGRARGSCCPTSPPALPASGRTRPMSSPGRLPGARGQLDGPGLSEIVGAAGYLRGKGAKKLLLMGASKRGTAVLTAALEPHPQPDAVVSLSAPTLYSGMNALGARQADPPVLHMAAESDAYLGDDAKALNRASTKAAEHKLIYARRRRARSGVARQPRELGRGAGVPQEVRSVRRLPRQGGT